MNQIEESVRTLLPRLIKGRQVTLTRKKQEALATWAVKTMLMLQHTHPRENQIVIPPGDFAALFAEGTQQPDDRAHRVHGAAWARNEVEASVEYVAEDRSMDDVARLLESEGEPPPADMRAYTATLRLGYWVAHLLRLGSPEIVSRLDPGPAARKYAVMIWPAHGQKVWPSRSLVEIGGMIALARSIDGGISVRDP